MSLHRSANPQQLIYDHEAAWVPANALQPVEGLASGIVAQGSCIGTVLELTK